MRLIGQTGIVIQPDEQLHIFAVSSASTDFEFFIQNAKQTIQEVDDRADSEIFEDKFYVSWIPNWVVIEGIQSEKIPAQHLNRRLKGQEAVSYSSQIQRQRLIFGNYLPQAQSDLIPSEEEKQQANIAKTAHIERISQAEVTERVQGIFRAIVEEVLEGKIEEAFTKSLSECIRQYEDIAVNEIQHFILKEKVSSESAEATLRILGDIDHQPTYHYRRWLLEKALICSSSPIVRDGANVGLSYMDDPHAIPFLKDAIKNEKLLLLRKVIEQTLVQLENE